MDGTQLVLEVTDTGVGLADAAAAPTGFGLAQVRERLANVYGERATMDFGGAPEGTGTRTLIRIPAVL